MRKNRIILSSLAFVVALTSFVSLKNIFSDEIKIITLEGNKTEKKKKIKGAAAYYKLLRADVATGEIDQSKVLAAREDVVNYIAKHGSNRNLQLSWEELGPDNIGGRTRAIQFDRSNPNIIYAAGVSGGVWKTTNGGSSWFKLNDFLDNLAVVSITQSANGTLYFGTGEGHYFYTGTGSAGILGAGVFKSTDGGVNFTQIPSTIPTQGNSAVNTVNWHTVNEMGSSPSNPNRIYAATNRGLMISDDAGESWKQAITGTAGQGYGDDVDVASDGSVVAVFGNKVYVSQNGDPDTYTSVTGSLPKLPSSARTEIAIAPSDPNFIYASVARPDGKAAGIYRSTDKGGSWTVIGPGGSATFAPLGNQGTFANTIAVYPNNKDKILVGGLDMWTWSSTGTWTQLTNWFYHPSNPRYLHADHHEIKFHPTNPNIIYFGNDGGVQRSLDGGETFQTRNKGYNITQFYTVAYSPTGEVMGGTQDNGTLYIDYSGTTPKAAERVNGGDGGYCEISFINPNAFFATVYYGDLRRSPNKGSSFSDFYSARATLAQSVGASFVTPIVMYESKNDLNSADTVTFTATKFSENIGAGNGTTRSFSDTLTHSSQPAATIIPGTIVVNRPGLPAIKDNGQGRFQKTHIDETAIDTINYTTGIFDLTFKTAPLNGSTVSIQYAVRYNSGAVVNVKSLVSNTIFKYTTPSAIDSSQSVKVQDIVQSRLVVGFKNSIWLTKQPLDFSKTPNWTRIATNLVSAPSPFSGQVQTMSFSGDGNHLFVGTEEGGLYRISNVNTIQANDTLTGEIGNAKSQLTCTRIAVFGGRAITGIGVDPKNADKVVVTLGNYGQTNYVYRTTTATTLGAASTIPAEFVSIQAGLPKMPVYDAIIDMTDGNKIIIGTEYGVWATGNGFTGNASSVTWTAENNGMALVPVFMVRQQTKEWTEVTNSGVIYIGTHGRGIFRSSTLVGVKENQTPGDKVASAAKPTVNVYPNPLNGEGSISLNLVSATDVKIRIYDLQGKMVKFIQAGDQQPGFNKVSFSSDDLKSGTYIINVTGNGVNAVSKFVVVK